MECITHAFFRSSDELHIIAVIILPLDTSAIQGKYYARPNGNSDFILPRAQRIELLKRSGLDGGFHWCYPGSVNEGTTKPFLDSVMKEAAKDGFKIEMVNLLGPDMITPYSRLINTIFVGGGDSPRMVYRGPGETGLLPVPGWSSWRMLPPMKNDLSKLVSDRSLRWLERKLQMLFPEQATNLPKDHLECRHAVTSRLQTAILSLGPTRICFQNKRKDRWVQFIPTRPLEISILNPLVPIPHMQSLVETGLVVFSRTVASSDVSSTDIRKALHHGSIETGVSVLDGMKAVNPELLWKYYLELIL
jgi:hypothetical protein